MGEKGKGTSRPATAKSIAQDLENRLAPMEEAQYENARWWRNLNRLMMIPGVFIIAAIVSQPWIDDYFLVCGLTPTKILLAVVATRMKS